MSRSRVIAIYAAAVAFLLFAATLISAAQNKNAGGIMGKIFAPIIAWEPAVAQVSGERIYRRDIYMLRLISSLHELYYGEEPPESNLTDAEALDIIIEQALLAASGGANGITVDESALNDTIAPLFVALGSEEGKSLYEAYKNEFGCSRATFESILIKSARRELSVQTYLLSLYYVASAQGVVPDEMDEDEALEMLRARLLIKLRVENKVEIY